MGLSVTPGNAVGDSIITPRDDSGLKIGETSNDLQPFGNVLRVTPERVVDKTVAQVRRQQACARLRFDRPAHCLQAGSAGAEIEPGDVVIDVLEPPTMPPAR
jgi:hypothetical protein